MSVERRGLPEILLYGDIEFHFDSRKQDAELWLIYFDDFEVPRGWGALQVDPWIIRRSLTRDRLETELSSMGKSFTVEPGLEPTQERLIVDSGVEFGFLRNDEDWGTCLFSVSQRWDA